VTRTIEEIQDALDAIVDPNPEADAPDLTDEQQSDVEALLAEMEQATARKERIDALTAKVRDGRKVATPALHVKSGPKVKDSIDAAFTAYLRTGQVNADLSELRAAQSEGTATEGGYLVPDSFRQKLVDRKKAFGGLANVVETITTGDGRSLEWPTIDDTANVGEIVSEGGTFSGGADLVFGTANLGAYAYMSGGASGTPLRLSKELVQDAAFDVEGLVANKLGERLGRIQATHLCNGTGVSQPKGITRGLTGSGMYSGASDALVYADFLTAIHAVDPAYRDGGNCRWAFNDTFLKAVRGVLDTNGRPILLDSQASIAGERGGATLLGYPVTIDNSFTSPTATSATVNFGVFGDLTEGYVRREVRGIELLVNPYARMQYRQIEYSAWSRMDATQQNTNAYVALTGTA
jgi:HK97 family phage major capsid protein